MSLNGSAEGGVLRGHINSLNLLTITAYGIAVKNGFVGTEKEWLESLKSKDGYKYPRLNDTQLSQMAALWAEYFKPQTGEDGKEKDNDSFYYNWDAVPNTYAAYPFDENGRTPMSCATFAQFIWSGIHPNTFIGKAGNYNKKIVKAFTWGYDFQFPLRNASGVTLADGSLIGFVKPHKDSYEDSYSANTYYTSDSTRADKQHFPSYTGGASMAQELYVLGCEIPMSEIMPGDMLFFRSPSLNDKQLDAPERKSFRNISHVAICYDTSKKSEGKIGIVECGGFYGELRPFMYVNNYTSDTPYSKDVHYADIANRICMVARHPAAFGISNPVGDKFTTR